MRLNVHIFFFWFLVLFGLFGLLPAVHSIYHMVYHTIYTLFLYISSYRTESQWWVCWWELSMGWVKWSTINWASWPH